MLNLKTLSDDAASLGLKCYLEGGRTKLEGSIAEVRRVLAAQGCDFAPFGTMSHSLYIGDAHTSETLVAVLCFDAASNYAYAYTV